MQAWAAPSPYFSPPFLDSHGYGLDTSWGVDASGLKVHGGKITGQINVLVHHSLREYSIDAAIEGERLIGEYMESYGAPDGSIQVNGPVSGTAPDNAQDGQYTLVLDKSLLRQDRGEAALLTVRLERKDGLFKQAVGMAPAFNTAIHYVDASGLMLDGPWLKGDLRVTLQPDAWVPTHHKRIHCVFTVSAAMKDGLIAGAYEGTFGVAQQATRSISGTLRGEADLRRENAFAPGMNWPGWYGPSGCFSVAPSGHRLVDNLTDARPVWRSEEVTPPGKSQSMRYGEANLRKRPGGGGCSPVVADGMVYLFYYVPSGDVYDEVYVNKERAEGRKVMPEQWLISADEYVLCLEAATGKTVWKTVFKDKGINWHDAKAGPCNTTPCVFNGRLYAIGTTGRVYCVDAKTGQPLWESNLGPRFEQIENLKAQCLAKRTLSGHSTFNRDHGGAPTYADGVLVTPDFNGSSVCGLLGLDGKTGQELWRIPKAGSSEATPSRWVYDGKEYVISANSSGSIWCVEPKTGKAMWQITDAGPNARTVAVWDRYLLANVGPLPTAEEKNPPRRLGCYEIGLAGAKRLWTLPQEYSYPDAPVIIYEGRGYARLPQRLVCLELATGRVLAEIAEDTGNGFGCAADGRLLLEIDGSHNDNQILMFRADPNDLRQMGEVWQPPHPNATTYYVPWSHPYVDGRLIMRGADGIYCYDLRQAVQ